MVGRNFEVGFRSLISFRVLISYLSRIQLERGDYTDLLATKSQVGLNFPCHDLSGRICGDKILQPSNNIYASPISTLQDGGSWLWNLPPRLV